MSRYAKRRSALKTEGYAISNRLTGKDIKETRKKLGWTQRELARFANVSVKTIERLEEGKKEISGPVIPLLKIISEYPQIPASLQIPEGRYPLRVWYLYRREICTIIDVDENRRLLEVYNYTMDEEKRAFGREENPSFEQYEALFKESTALIPEDCRDGFWIKKEKLDKKDIES
jgi:putative transcriptional regulator